MEANGLFIFAGNSNPELAKKICGYLKLPLGGAKVTTFSDGEIQIEIHDNVRARDVFVIQSTCAPESQTLIDLSRAIRSAIGGWVENRLSRLQPESGLTINR